MKQASAYCTVCERQVLAQGKPPNHILHLILSIFTLGLWLPVWILLVVGTIGNYRCSRCGNRVSRGTSGDAGRAGAGRPGGDED